MQVSGLGPCDDWPSTQRSAPSLLIAEVWSTQCKSSELAEVQGRGHTICVKSPSSPPQTRERLLGRPPYCSSAQPQETKGAGGGRVGQSRCRPCQVQALLLHPSLDCFWPWALYTFSLALPASEARQTHGCPWCLLTYDQVTLSE